MRERSSLKSGGELSRRRVLKGAGAAAIALTAPAFLPAAMSASPAETVVTGHVGIGGRGGTLLGWVLGHAGFRVGAVCEVDAQRREVARKRSGDQVFSTGDFRRVLDRGDIDAVVVATPDHWHAGVTIAACRAGKDVYVEKPSSHNVAGGRAMVQAARDHSRVVQVGIHHRSSPYNREISRIIRGGRIGKIHAVKCWMWENPRKPRTAVRSAPEHLDWDFWLGPAPKVGYHPDRVHFNFRWCRDYAGGYMTDWGVHMFNIVTCAMNVDHMGPDSVEATGEFASDNLYDFPMKMQARWKYSDPDFELSWIQPSAGGDLLPEQRYAMNFYGEDGELRAGFGLGLQKFYRDGKEAPLPREGKSVEVPESPGHLQNWLDCIRSRELPIADIEIGHRTTLTCLLANIALFSGKKRLGWNWRDEKFVDDPAADEWLSRTPREGWGS